MGNKDKFNEQLKRVRHWLEVLAAVSSSAFGIETTRSPFGDELWSVRLGKDAFVMGVVDVETAGKNNAFLVIAETAANWPNPMELKVTPAQDDTLVHWLVTLDDKSRGQLVQALAEVSQERGAKDFNMLFFDKFLPVTDTGWISVEGRSLCAVSTHGLMPALIPGVLEMLKKSISPETHEMRTVAARLRFLLDLAGQARFRGLDLMAEAPERLPGDLSELLFSDSLGKAWLDNEFGKFPGAFHNVTEILSVLAKGEAVDGYQYHIDSGNDGWSVLAENGAGQRLRINAQGIVSAFENGAWVEQVDSLLDFGKYFQ